MNNKSTKHEHRGMLKITSYAIIVAILIIVVGGVFYISKHEQATMVLNDFHGQPHYLTSAVQIFRAAISGDQKAIIQLGILILLMNPFLRICMLTISYIKKRNYIYVAICGLILIVLSIVLFG